MTEKPPGNCSACKYYYITWDVHFPKGCSLFKFKSKNPPSYLVYEATGAPCEHYVANPKRKTRPQ